MYTFVLHKCKLSDGNQYQEKSKAKYICIIPATLNVLHLFWLGWTYLRDHKYQTYNGFSWQSLKEKD